MTKILFSALVLAVCAAAVRAQTVEDANAVVGAAGQSAAASMSKAHRAAVKAQLSAPVVFPKTIVCDGGNALQGSYKFYPRLDSIKTLGDLDETKPTNLAWGFTPEKDETAADLDDGHAISATRSQLHYDMVSCDTQDYFFTFQIPQLAKAASSQEATRKITGHVRIETRGHVDADANISCTANY